MVGDGRRTELLPHLTRVERKVLWGGLEYIVALKGAQRSRQHYIRSGDDAGQPFVRIIDPHTEGCSGITSYLHGKTRGRLEKALKQEELICAVQLVRNTYEDSSKRLCLDYIILDSVEKAKVHPILVKKSAELDEGGDTEGMKIITVTDSGLTLLYAHP